MATDHDPHQSHWLDDHDQIHGTCGCGHDCSTHPDAAYSLDQCGDCGADTCEDCRVTDPAGRCSTCADRYYRQYFAQQEPPQEEA